ncbi:hypothetical protein [Acinetobacter seifertii]|uniref:hypothetical protein n=1 Tax=Acinetobacter seifertii TaxID=1530123 RepID=UPI000C22451D|nr:hypothetical protein [Acinetobacter seifertii]PJG67811.1 hypothetical protein CVD09_03675 [Acinetobacter seifertii]
MFICIGGDLDGEVVIREGFSFKANEIDLSKNSTYDRQSYIVEDNIYRFWLCAELPYFQTTKIAKSHLAKIHKHLA